MVGGGFIEQRRVYRSELKKKELKDSRLCLKCVEQRNRMNDQQYYDEEEKGRIQLPNQTVMKNKRMQTSAGKVQDR